MRTLLIIGAVLLVVVGLLAFALINLNSLIASMWFAAFPKFWTSYRFGERA